MFYNARALGLLRFRGHLVAKQGMKIVGRNMKLIGAGDAVLIYPPSTPQGLRWWAEEGAPTFSSVVAVERNRGQRRCSTCGAKRYARLACTDSHACGCILEKIEGRDDRNTVTEHGKKVSS